MGSYNKVMLMGNVTKDLNVKSLPSGQNVVDVGLAMNRVYYQDEVKKEETTFVDVTFWGKQAETLGQYLTKGRPLFIEGRLKMDNWNDKDGNKRYKLKVIGEHFQFIGGKQDAEAPEQKTLPPAKTIDQAFDENEIPF